MMKQKLQHFHEKWNRQGKWFKFRMLFGLACYGSVLFIGVVGGVFLLISGILGQSFGKVDWPDPGIADSLQGQEYVSVTDERFPTVIKFPDLPLYLKVGGTEASVTENGCVFSYQSPESGAEYMLLAYQMKDGWMGPEHMLKELFQAKDMEGSRIPFTYEQGLFEEGYHNTIPLTYETGLVKRKDTDYFLSCYYMDTGMDTNVALAVMGEEKELLEEQLALLDRMFFSLRSSSEQLLPLPEKETDPAEASREEAGGQEDPSADLSVSSIQEDSASHGPLASSGNVPWQIPNIPEVGKVEGLYAETFSFKEEVTTSHPEGYFIFTYTAQEPPPSSVVLHAPDGTEYTQYSFDDLLKEIRFEIPSAMTGTWELVCSVDDRNLGYGVFSYLSRETYEYLDDPDKKWENRTYPLEDPVEEE